MPYKTGNLYVIFKVNFPASIPQKHLAKVTEALSMQKAADMDMSDASETVMLQKYDESQRNTEATGGQERDEDSDEESSGHQGGQRV